jgi:hypothetical protein
MTQKPAGQRGAPACSAAIRGGGGGGGLGGFHGGGADGYTAADEAPGPNYPKLGSLLDGDRAGKKQGKRRYRGS